MILERAMLAFVTKVLLIVRRRLRSLAILRAENNLVLRQQVLILSRKSPAGILVEAGGN